MSKFFLFKSNTAYKKVIISFAQNDKKHRTSDSMQKSTGVKNITFQKLKNKKLFNDL